MDGPSLSADASCYIYHLIEYPLNANKEAIDIYQSYQAPNSLIMIFGEIHVFRTHVHPYLMRSNFTSLIMDKSIIFEERNVSTHAKMIRIILDWLD